MANPELAAGALAKPEPRKRVKAREKRKTLKARIACREIVLERAEWRCARCGMPISDYLPEWHPQRAHVNEPGGRGRGDYTDPDQCEALCQRCHLPNGRHAPTQERLEILTGQRKGKA